EIDRRAVHDAAQWPEMLRRAQLSGPPRRDVNDRHVEHDATVEERPDLPEIAPRGIDPEEWREIVRRTRARHQWEDLRVDLDAIDDEHAAALRAEEQLATPPESAKREKRRSRWLLLLVVPMFAIILVPALVTRLVTRPFRGLIRDYLERRADRRRERA